MIPLRIAKHCICIAALLLLLRNDEELGVQALAFSLPPPPPQPRSIPLPAKLAGGLFLFATSVQPQDKALCRETLKLAEETLRSDPLISMELGAGLEAGGVFASSSSRTSGIEQLICDFQINGGNSWAQAKVHGVKIRDKVQLVSLEVGNMDAAFNGGFASVTLPPLELEEEEEETA